MPEKNFAFDLNQPVTVTISNESGTVIGRAEYTNSSNTYYVRYLAKDGRATHDWFPEDALQAS